MESQQAQRKNEHLSLATKLYAKTHQRDYFNEVRLIHTALPETGVSNVDHHTTLAPGLRLDWPFYIEAMTGGSQQAQKINLQLARLAKKHHLAMATGSMSIALKEPAVVPSFTAIRKVNPHGLVFANLSADADYEQAQKAIGLLHADALELHLNAAQELVMPEGERSFNWLANIRQLAQQLTVPVIVKEVGFGMSKENICQLQEAGATLINVSGRGGTNFAMIEGRRNRHNDFTPLYDWGQTTPESLLEARAAKTAATIIASGGITSPLDVVKAGVLGAKAVGVAGYFLEVLMCDGEEALDQVIADWQVAIVRLLTLLGCHSFAELGTVDFILQGGLYEYAQQRKLI